MIKISVTSSKDEAGPAGAGNIVKILITGHAVYRNSFAAFLRSAVTKKNSNIVCAAVSALSINLLKSIILIAAIETEYQQRNGYLMMNLNISKADPDKLKSLNILLQSFLIGITDIKENYPELIEIETIDCPLS